MNVQELRDSGCRVRVNHFRALPKSFLKALRMAKKNKMGSATLIPEIIFKKGRNAYFRQGELKRCGLLSVALHNFGVTEVSITKEGKTHVGVATCNSYEGSYNKKEGVAQAIERALKGEQ